MIKVENLTKYYGKRLAVDNISFNIEKGEIVGFLGPNGAGKTTTMRMLTGYLSPTEGDIWIGDHDMSKHSLEARQSIGYFPEATPLYTDMTVRSYLDFSSQLRGMDKDKTKKRISEVVEVCHLEEYVDVIIGKLSKGFRQRVGIAQSIIHEPEVLILDEPTVGIDPIQVAMTRQLIKDLGEDCTILISTHILPEVSVTCERVLIINEGRIVAKDSIENLSAMISGARRFRLEVEGPVEKVSEQLRKVASVMEVQCLDSYYFVECSTGADPRAKITEAIVASGWTLLSLEAIEMSLEDIFLKLTTTEDKN
ncbi:ATP-binding cassette domain-containing protein [Chloroflexota bacterium]